MSKMDALLGKKSCTWLFTTGMFGLVEIGLPTHITLGKREYGLLTFWMVGLICMEGHQGQAHDANLTQVYSSRIC